MNSSPFLSESVKNYLNENDVSVKLTKIVNDLIKEMPDDPNSFISSSFAKYSTKSAKLKSIKAVEVLNPKGLPSFKAKYSFSYQEEDYEITPNSIYLRDSDNPENILTFHLYHQGTKTQKDIMAREWKKQLHYAQGFSYNH